MILFLAACQHAPEIVAVTDRGPLEQDAMIKGRDGGSSGTFQGRSVWLYGDTVLAAEGEDGSSWRDNSWSWTEDLDGSDGITDFSEPADLLDAPREFFPETDEEHAYNEAHRGGDGAREILWPGPIVDLGDRALAFWVKIHGEPGEWNFFARGTGIAVWTDWDEGPVRPDVRPGTDEPTILWPGEDTAGNGALLHEGYVYTYECRNALTGRPCAVTRAPVDDVLDPDAWQWWTGKDWGDADHKATVFGGAPQVDVHWNEYLGAFLAIYDPGGANEIVFRTAPAPEGPWSRSVHAFDTEKPADGGWTYCGYGHAEYARDEGRFETITYYRGTGDWRGEIRVVEVEFARAR